MELSSAESIRALALQAAAPVRMNGRGNSCNAGVVIRRDRRKRCSCGQCRQCSENARWESIFAKKFLDPDYYTRSVVRRSSPLNSL